MSTYYCEQCNPNWQDQETYGRSYFFPCQKCGTTVNVRYQPGDPLKPVSEEKQMHDEQCEINSEACGCELRRELAAARAEAGQLRELLNVYNLGGWTDAERLLKERDAARAELAEWAKKAEAWVASPEAAQRLEGYRELGARAAAAENERDSLRAQLERAMKVVEEAKELWANSEEYDFDEGLGRGAEQQWWDNLDRAIEEWKEAGR
jgi:hypothetical protein